MISDNMEVSVSNTYADKESYKEHYEATDVDPDVQAVMNHFEKFHM